MKAKAYTIQFLVVQQSENKFLGLCKELGFVEEGNSLEYVKERLVNGAIAVVEAVNMHPELEPSFSVGLPIKYWILFHYFIFRLHFQNLSNSLFFTKDTDMLVPMHG